MNVQYLNLDTCKHRVDRVLGFFSCRPNWDPHSPHPPPAGECAPPLLVPVGGHTRLREKGWGVLIQTRGQTLWYSRYFVLCTLCAQGFYKQYSHTTDCRVVYVCMFGISARICKLLSSPGIDFWAPQTFTNSGSGQGARHSG